MSMTNLSRRYVLAKRNVENALFPIANHNLYPRGNNLACDYNLSFYSDVLTHYILTYMIRRKDDFNFVQFTIENRARESEIFHTSFNRRLFFLLNSTNISLIL